MGWKKSDKAVEYTYNVPDLLLILGLWRKPYVYLGLRPTFVLFFFPPYHPSLVEKGAKL